MGRRGRRGPKFASLVSRAQSTQVFPLADSFTYTEPHDIADMCLHFERLS
jgi:hypothetical protein